MSDPKELRGEDHWRSLAEEFGLPPEPDTPAPPQAARPAAAPVPSPVREPEPAPARYEASPAKTEMPAAPSVRPVPPEVKEAPVPKRGRGQRGRRPEGDKPGQQAVAQGEEPRRRGRGRGRGKKAAEVELAHAAVKPVSPEEPVSEAGTDEDDPGIYGNWNAFSWQELISSLYRPER